MVKPAEKIESIKVHRISGGIGGGATGTQGKAGSAINQVQDLIMEMAVQLTAMKEIGKELGISIEKTMAGDTAGGR